MPPPAARGGVGGATTMGALYTGRGPVCGISTRRGATTGRIGAGAASGACAAGACGSAGAATASFAFAAISAGGATGDSPTTAGDGVTCAAASVFSCAEATAEAAGAAGLGGAGVGACGPCSLDFEALAPPSGVAGAFTTTLGGTTVTMGRAETAPAGAFATTAPAGG